MTVRSSMAMILALIALTGCAAQQHTEPVHVTVADIEALPSEGLEMLMLVKLRVQNPNETPLDYDGVSVQVDVLDKDFASGVTNDRGTVDRYGEAVIAVPVTVSMLHMVRQVMGLLEGQNLEHLAYRMHGQLSGPRFGTVRFESKGELSLPASAPAANETIN